MSAPDNQINESCTLVRDQELPIGNDSLTVHRTELTKSDFDAFTLIVEASGNFALGNQLFEDPKLINGQQLVCCYDGTESKATLAMFTKQEFGSGGQKLILHFACSTIEAGEAEGEVFEFLVPHVYFGQGDYSTRADYPGGISQTYDQIKFVINGAEWTLRTLFEIDGYYLPAPQARDRQLEAGAGKINFNPSGHCALHVQTSKLDVQSAEMVATDICWLLHLAFAQSVAWAELRVRTGFQAKFVRRLSHTIPKKASGTTPLRNWGNGLIKQFLENAFTVFQGDARWWRETLNWISIANERLVIESSGMIMCVLLDRLSSKILKDYDYPKQIGKDLAAFLQSKSQKRDLRGKIQQLMQDIEPSWTENRTNALVGKIQEWNDSPPYAKKIAIAFQESGLTPPSDSLLEKRHLLLHQGKMEMRGQEAVDFFLDLNMQVLALVFTMLGYQGKFFALGRGERKMESFLLNMDSTKKEEK